MTKKDEQVHINLIVEKLTPDRNAYKPYGLSFIPHRTMVSVPISSKEVTVTYLKDIDGNETAEADMVVLTLDGLMELTGRIADSIDNLHNKHLEDLTLGNK